MAFEMPNTWSKAKTLLAMGSLPVAVLVFYLFYNKKKRKSVDNTPKEQEDKQNLSVSNPGEESSASEEVVNSEPINSNTVTNSLVVEEKSEEKELGDSSADQTIVSQAESDLENSDDSFKDAVSVPTENCDVVKNDTEEIEHGASCASELACNEDSASFQTNEENLAAGDSITKTNTKLHEACEAPEFYQDDKKSLNGMDSLSSSALPEMNDTVLRPLISSDSSESKCCELDNSIDKPESNVLQVSGGRIETASIKLENTKNEMEHSVPVDLCNETKVACNGSENACNEAELACNTQKPACNGTETADSSCEAENEVLCTNDAVLNGVQQVDMKSDDIISEVKQNGCLKNEEQILPTEAIALHLSICENTQVSDNDAHSPILEQTNSEKKVYDNESYGTSDAYNSESLSSQSSFEQDCIFVENPDKLNGNLNVAAGELDNLSTVVQTSQLSDIDKSNDTVKKMSSSEDLTGDLDKTIAEENQANSDDIKPVSEKNLVLAEDNCEEKFSICSLKKIEDQSSMKDCNNLNQSQVSCVQNFVCQTNGFATHHDSDSSAGASEDVVPNLASVETNSLQETHSNVESSLISNMSSNNESESLISSSESLVQEKPVCGDCLKNSEKERKRDKSKSALAKEASRNGYVIESTRKSWRSPYKKEVNRNANNNTLREFRRHSNHPHPCHERMHNGIHNEWNETMSSSSNEGSEPLSKKRGKHRKDDKTNSSDKRKEIEVFVEFPADQVGILIGKQGKNIKQLKSDSGAEIFVHETKDRDGIQVLQIRGTQAAVESCAHRVKRRFNLSSLPHFNKVEKLDMLSGSKTLNGEGEVPTDGYQPYPPQQPPHAAGYMLPHAVYVPTFFPDAVELPRGKVTSVRVSTISNINCVFVQNLEDPSFLELDNLHQAMQKIYSQPTPPLSLPIYPGFPAAVQQDGVWYRAQTRDYYEESEEVAVYLIDYGGYVRVPCSSAKQMREDLLYLPSQAIECFLQNVAPIDDNDAESYNKKAEMFQEILNGGVFKAKVNTYVLNAAGITCPVVQLYKFYGGQTTMINSEIIKRGIANWERSETM